VQSSLIATGAFDANLKVELLLNDYMQNVVNGVDQLPWSQQQATILNDILPIKGANGKTVLAAIEGPNEINDNWDGGGAHPPDSVVETDNNFAAAQAAFLSWAQALWAFRAANATALGGVELLSPTILYYTADNSEWGTLPSVKQYVDYGTFHYYSGNQGTDGVPSWPSDPDNFAVYYGLAQNAINPGGSMVQSEGGASMEAGTGYAPDGRSQARYFLMQLFDHFAVGGHRFMLYELFDGNTGTSDPQDNYGIYKSDELTPKPSAIAMHNLASLLSLNDNWLDPANLSDIADFVPAYSGAGFSISGLASAGAAGSSLIMPKSDGSTIIAVWNEPEIDDGSGVSLNPAADPIVVNFGSTHAYRVFDPTGGGNVPAFVATPSLQPIAAGTGSSVSLDLYGTPLLIELLAH
jgi:hypothetical protein